jgi:hypothetical protein
MSVCAGLEVRWSMRGDAGAQPFDEDFDLGVNVTNAADRRLDFIPSMIDWAADYVPRATVRPAR